MGVVGIQGTWMRKCYMVYKKERKKKEKNNLKC